MKFKFRLPLIFFGTLLLMACKKESNFEKQPIQINETYAQKWDKTVQQVAKDVSEKINSLAFRKMLKHEVLLRFDGDANILISSIMKRLPKYLAYEKNTQVANRRVSEGDLLSSF